MIRIKDIPEQFKYVIVIDDRVFHLAYRDLIALFATHKAELDKIMDQPRWNEQTDLKEEWVKICHGKMVAKQE